MAIEIPAGYRQLAPDEKVIKGDKFWDLDNILSPIWHKSGNYKQDYFGNSGEQSSGCLYIREISTEIPMIDLNKPIQLRNGTPATIIARGVCRKGRDDDFTIIYRENKEDTISTYNRSGIFVGSRDYDVINVPLEKKKFKIFINIYKSGKCVGHTTRAMAESFSGGDKIACVEREIEYTEGEGLENEED